MDTLVVTIIGQDLFKMVVDKFELAGFNQANQINTGMLGNLKIQTHIFEISEDEIIDKRKKLLSAIGDEPMRMMALFTAGDWMRIIVMKPLKI